jgi:AP-2 complex subunit mu-1
MIYALFIITQKGDVLLNQIYRDGVSKGIAEAFRLQVVTSKEQRSPLKQIGDTSFVHVRDKDLYVVAVTKDNSDATGIFEVLYALIKIFKSYFGSFDEESVKDNIVTVVEVLEEILDYGFPQTTDADSIKNLITTQSKAIKKAREDQISQITIQTTGQLPWRPVDLRYKRNEIYIDVIESVNLLMSTAGNVLKADVTGQIMMKTQLSGMPECKLGMNDKILLDKETKMGKKPKTANGIELDDVTMHQCVKLGRFDADRTISFVPPDGEFELMRYVH